MLREKVQKKLGKAFDKKLADAVHEFTCSKVIEGGEFDYESQEWSASVNLSYSGRGVLFGSYRRSLIKPADYQENDCKAILLQNEVTRAPEIGDVWETPLGKYRIISGGFDAAQATYVFQLRGVIGDGLAGHDS